MTPMIDAPPVLIDTRSGMVQAPIRAETLVPTVDTTSGLIGLALGAVSTTYVGRQAARSYHRAGLCLTQTG